MELDHFVVYLLNKMDHLGREDRLDLNTLLQEQYRWVNNSWLLEEDVSPNLLNQLEQFVYLFESPIFLRIRMRLLEPRKHHDLLKTLLGVSIFLPHNCAATGILQRRMALCQGGLMLEGGSSAGVMGG